MPPRATPDVPRDPKSLPMTPKRTQEIPKRSQKTPKRTPNALICLVAAPLVSRFPFLANTGLWGGRFLMVFTMVLMVFTMV
jgi:hypothetical protein